MFSGIHRIHNPQAGPPAASIADKLNDSLSRPLKIENYKSTPTVQSLLRHLKDHRLKDVPMRVMFHHDEKVQNVVVELVGGELPVGAWLTVVQDSAPELRFVIREYGLLVTTADRVPPDGMLLGEFMRRAKTQDARPKEKKKQ